MSRQIISVHTFVHYLKGKLECDPLTRGVFIEGEISNFSPYRSGHWYFSLKDQQAQMRCVMFKSSNAKLSFMPKDGDKVIIRGDASIYEGRGDLQCIVTDMKPSGLGDLYMQYEALKKKLNEQGLFDPAHKKKIPAYPCKLGLVTGKNTAARSDVLSTLQRRFPSVLVYECNALVQGSESARQVCDALLTLDEMNLDVILLVRGGGSIEDLFSFNDETMAHVIYNMKTPLITGIGHEVDFTIADFVADMRAPTPTGAAEMATPDLWNLKLDLEKMQTRMQHAMSASLIRAKHNYATLCNSRVFVTPEILVRDKMMQLQTIENSFFHQMRNVQSKCYKDLHSLQATLYQQTKTHLQFERSNLEQLETSLITSVSNIQTKNKNALQKQIALLDAYSPLKVLQRGYSIAKNKTGVITSVDDIDVNTKLNVVVQDGVIETLVQTITRKDTK